jgi:hypothetical protein
VEVAEETTVRVVDAVPLTAGVKDEAVRLQVTFGPEGATAQFNPTVPLKLLNEVTVGVDKVVKTVPKVVDAAVGVVTMEKSLTVRR